MMVKLCVVYNYNNTNKTGHALHQFLKEEGLRRQWVPFVKADTQNSQTVEVSCAKPIFCRSTTAWKPCWKKTLLPGSVLTVQLQCYAVGGQQIRCSHTKLCAATPDYIQGVVCQTAVKCLINRGTQLTILKPVKTYKKLVMSCKLIPDSQIEMAADLRSAVFLTYCIYSASYTVSSDHGVVLVDASVPLRIF